MILNRESNNFQRTEDWHADRLGRFSCSQFHRLMATVKRPMTEQELSERPKGSRVTTIEDKQLLSDGANTYILECLAERLTGERAKDDFSSKYTEWGTEYEPLAKNIYEAVFELKVEDSPYIPYGDFSGGSPDGLVGDDGIIEIKCPYTITSHLEHKLITSIEEFKSSRPEYYWQCLGYLLITQRTWIDFISWHPKYPVKHQLKRLRITKNEVSEDINTLEIKIQSAVNQLELLLNSI